MNQSDQLKTSVSATDKDARDPNFRISSSIHPIPHQLLRRARSSQRLGLASVMVIGLMLVALVSGLWLLICPCLMPFLLLTATYAGWELVYPNFCLDVWDAGDRLIFDRQGDCLEVPLDQIHSVQFKRSNAPPRAVVQLRIPSRWGSQLTFVPDQRAGREASRVAIDHLNQRIQARVRQIERDVETKE